MRETPERVFPIVVSAMPITSKQRKAAIAVVALLFLVAAVTAPFAHLQLGRIDAFIPVLQTVICVADLITAIFLFAQYPADPRPAILVLAAGYIASGMFAFVQTLAFPGAYAPDGLFGDGRNTAGWFFVWWHTTFPLVVIIYAFLKDRIPSGKNSTRPARVMIVIAIACIALWIAGLTWLAASGTSYLPDLFTDSVIISMPLANQINLFLWTLGAIAILVVFLRRRTILDLWLIVTLFAWMPNFIIAALLSIHRFSMGWYTARGFALFASCTVLAVLLTETTVLHARLANAITLLLRERANRLMSLDASTGAIAHEIRQPLTGIISTSSAGTNWLNAASPDLEKLNSCFASIKKSAHRVEDIISSVRKLFKDGGSDTRKLISLNETAREALALMHQDLARTQISVSTDFQPAIPKVEADYTQLQQVVLNLIKNSTESMEGAVSERKQLHLMTGWRENSVFLSIQDSGSGISPVQRERVFDPFFTTKASGMGLGLFISETIIKQHGGDLQLVKSDSSGCVFEIVLPVSSPNEI